RRHTRSPLFPYTTLFRSRRCLNSFPYGLILTIATLPLAVSLFSFRGCFPLACPSRPLSHADGGHRVLQRNTSDQQQSSDDLISGDITGIKNHRRRKRSTSGSYVAVPARNRIGYALIKKSFVGCRIAQIRWRHFRFIFLYFTDP